MRPAIGSLGNWPGSPIASSSRSIRQAARGRRSRAAGLLSLPAPSANTIRRHLITVGLLPNSLEGSELPSGFVPQAIAGHLDFICVHLYPKTGKLKEDLKLLQGFVVGKPVVIEEIYPLTCTVPELRQFIEASRKHAAGWVGFYWGQTPAELSKPGSIAEAITATWLKSFQEMNPN